MTFQGNLAINIKEIHDIVMKLCKNPYSIKLEEKNQRNLYIHMTTKVKIKQTKNN